MAGEKGWDGSDLIAPGLIDTTKIVQLYVVEGATACEVGDGAFYFAIDSTWNGYVLSSASAKVITAGTTGTMDIQLHNVTTAADMLTTKITIDSTETSSATAATPYVIDTDNDDVSTGHVIRVDIDAVHTTPAQGLLLTLKFDPA